ncbi:Neuron navigator 1 [Myotis davidii]|uniref:Neuron navigator 1 n=1 Tax=Myotis davidii TaxID=225400 RepID=L5M9K0_MYODS|nr:Neuron navigator 1 [Myotis davidii]
MVAREGIPVRQARGRSPARTSPLGETQAPVPPDSHRAPNGPGNDQRDRSFTSSVSSELEAGARSGAPSPAVSPVQGRGPSPAPGAISFSSVHQHSPPITATVAPFQYRLQTEPEPGPPPQGSWAVDGYSTSTGGTEDGVSCVDPESQRKRTVQNVLDLRQNLEETMSSLRGSQVTHRAAVKSFVKPPSLANLDKAEERMQSEVGRPASSRLPAPSTPRPPGLPVPPPKLSLSSFSQQIRKLRRELESSQEKVATLTSQLSANANLVAAFEQSLVNMTSRLRHLAETAEEKDTELLDLRETIDFLKKKNSEAQAVIQGALNASETTPKELRIKRQNSSDSISSLNSVTSHSSIGSGKDADAKKKKKKSWLRSSFNKAFSIKKGPKSASSYSDIEEIATPDSSAPSSPKLQHGATETASPSIKGPVHTAPHPRLFLAGEEEEPEKKEVSELRSELWEKEMKLTDIRLEALNSAHQLDQLRETMHNMQADALSTEPNWPGP